MSNRVPFSHPDLEIARSLLRELRSFAFPQLEDDEWAQKAACKAIARVRNSMKYHEPKIDTPPEPEMDWG